MLDNETGHRILISVAAGAATISLLAGPPLLADEASPDAAADSRGIGTLEAADDRYRQAMAAELYSEAADAGKLYIGELLKDPDFDRLEWSRALTQLANAQSRDQQFDAAIENYLLSIETLETATNGLHESLIGPLASLGPAYFETGDYGNAARTFKRTVHLQRVNEGLNSLALGRTLDALAETHFRLDDHARAHAYEQAYVSVYTQNFPGHDVRRLPALYSQAQMYRRTSRDFDAQSSYLRIISLIEHAEGSRSLHLLRAIYETADLMQVDTVLDGMDSNYRARRYLRRAIHIAEHNEDATPVHVADAHIKMGDFLATNTADRRAALRHYDKAWSQLSADENLIAARDQRFAEPTLLNEYPRTTVPDMRKLLLMSVDANSTFDPRLLVRYDVDEIGETRNIELVEPDPTGRWDYIVIKHVGKFVFRPAFVDGEPTETPDQTYEIRYSITNTAESAY